MPLVSLPTGIEMFYEVEGTGEPVLLIMGTAADHTPWARQVKDYRDHFTVITYDHRGTGRSTHPPDPRTYSMRVLADDAAALLDHLDLGPAHVSGLSLGSATAQELAVNHPGQGEVAATALHLGALRRVVPPDDRLDGVHGGPRRLRGLHPLRPDVGRQPRLHQQPARRRQGLRDRLHPGEPPPALQGGDDGPLSGRQDPRRPRPPWTGSPSPP